MNINRANKVKLLTILLMIFVCVCLDVLSASLVQADVLTIPRGKRPYWLRQEGMIMAGSWEPLFFRVRRDGSTGYIPTEEQRIAYQQEHSPEMVSKLKELGVNFVMTHCYKGAGIEYESASMADAVKFAKLCRAAGMHVGVYNYSGTFLWELLYQEVPQAAGWVLLNALGLPKKWNPYRYCWDRNHPDAQEYYKKIVQFAVQKIGANLLHFDNYTAGPGTDINSVQRFRQYLRDRFTSQQLQEMEINPDTALPDMAEPPTNLLGRIWLEFSCKSLADSYQDMARYARSLRSNTLIECNPGLLRNYIKAPVDHGRLLQGGEAFWDESPSSGFIDGQLRSRIRTYKVARVMNNMAFAYTSTPLDMAETMAFNLDCLGCICKFEYGKIVTRFGSTDPVSQESLPFIAFFRNRPDILRNTTVMADVAVLRSFSSQVFADPKFANLTYQVEQKLIENNVCFQIVYDQHLHDLKRYKVLILAGCPAFSELQVQLIRQYVEGGGKLVTLGENGTADEWMRPRQSPSFDGLPSARVIQTGENGDVVAAVRQICPQSLFVQPPTPGLCTELTRKGNNRLVHLVNYRSDASMDNVQVRLLLPVAGKVKSVILSSPQRQNDLNLPFTIKGRYVTFTVPQIKIYEIAAVTLE